MTHEEAYALMMEALDGLLTWDGRQQLEEHLALCSECRSEWQALQFVEGLFTNAPAIPAPPDFYLQLQVKLEVASWRRTLGALFALGVGSLVALFFIAVPAAVALAGIWSALNNPKHFAQGFVWFNKLVIVSGSLLDAGWTTVRLAFMELAANPLTLAWGLLAALALAIWTQLVRPAVPVPASGN